MKYRRLRQDELESLEKEFVRFLASNQVTAEDWEKLKAGALEKAEKLIEIFSDIVFEKILSDVEYMEFQTPRDIKTFHFEEVRIPILASTPPDGIVLDPFNGSGTSTIFARTHGFRSIGIDISREYCTQAAEALTHLDAALTTPSREGYDELSEPGDD